jgi:phosphoribosyl-ATP pyrophosphohydrolase/phosphoribosyl-AMP cyclohydrolase
MRINSVADLDTIDFGKAGALVPVIVQQSATGEVLMLGYADREALTRCLQTSELWLYSRSRRALWRKGETSGHTQRVMAMFTDCDRDSVLVHVEPAGPACHTGTRSCFEAAPVLPALSDVIAQRAIADPETSYTARLLGDENLRLKKLGEEAVELAMACTARDTLRVAEEGADLLYHLLAACAATGVGLDQIAGVLAGRTRAAG